MPLTSRDLEEMSVRTLQNARRLLTAAQQDGVDWAHLQTMAALSELDGTLSAVGAAICERLDRIAILLDGRRQ